MQREVKLLDKSTISVAAACVIVMVLSGAGYSTYKDLIASLPSKDVVENNTARIEKTINWVKDLDAAKKDEAKALESRIQAEFDRKHADDMAFQAQVLHRFDLFDAKMDSIAAQIARHGMLGRPHAKFVAY